MKKYISIFQKYNKPKAKYMVCFCMMFWFPLLYGNTLALNRITIQIPDRIKINHDQITLGRISEIVTEDREALERLQNIFITDAPNPGKTLRINTSYVQTRLKQNNVALNRLDLNAPPEILVTRKCFTFTKPMIEKAVFAYLFKNMPWDKEHTKIKKITVNQDVVLPSGNITYRVGSGGEMKYSGTMSLPVNFYVNGEQKRKIWVSVCLEVMREVVVAKRPLGRYQPITRNDIEMKKIDVAKLTSKIPLRFEDLIGKRTKRKIHVGTVMKEELVELPPLIKPGDRVKLVAESSGLRITAYGVARKKGRRGERIMVVNLDSKKTINAKVVDSSTVKVDF